MPSHCFVLMPCVPPAFVTRYIVAETLQPILAERFETLRRQHEDDAKVTAELH
jgi:hypothetical protein